MAETLARSLIRLLVTVAILAAVYFFAIRPILDTTNNAFDSFDGLNDGIQNTLEDAGIAEFDIPNDKQKVNRLQQCVQRASQDVDKVQRCVDRFN